MNQLHDIQLWKKELGLLPINLFSGNLNDEFILLNGGYGDFCIDFEKDKSPNQYFSNAWSSNTNNFIALNNNLVFVFNWHKEKQEPPYEVDIVSQNLEKFYQYLLKNSYKSEYDIVPFIINIYKSLRNFTNEPEQGVQALNYLFLLMAAYEENKSFNEIDFQKWQLPSDIQILPEIERHFDEFAHGIQYKNLKPNIELIIRHAAGELFQEAQKEAIFFSRNKDLFGLYDISYKTNRQLFSSFHYTPSYLARSIVEYALSKINLQATQNLKILDPSCGSSEFLLEVLKQLKTQGYSGKIKIHGWDSSQSAISISKFLLAYEKREWGNNLSLNIELVEDSLTKAWDNAINLIKG